MKNKKSTRKKSQVTCENCKKNFLKDDSEIKRNFEIGRKIFCSLSCSGKFYNVLKPYSGINSVPNYRFHDEYTGLRLYIRKAYRKNKNKNCQVNITLKYLKDLWNSQDGKCIYTGIDLFHRDLPINKNKKLVEIASLDRINSHMGYTENNVQFVNIMANWAKKDLSHDEMVIFCKSIALFWKNGCRHDLVNSKIDLNKDNFKEYIRRIKNRPKEYIDKFKMSYDGINVENTVNEDDLLEQWNKQHGICIYSGINLVHAKQTKNRESNSTNIASLDRVNSNLGYIKDNVQFVSITANLAKNKLKHEEMIEFCKAIYEFWKDKI